MNRERVHDVGDRPEQRIDASQLEADEDRDQEAVDKHTCYRAHIPHNREEGFCADCRIKGPFAAPHGAASCSANVPPRQEVERATSIDFGKPRALAPLRIVGASLGTTARSE